MNFVNTYLALDREIVSESIPLSVEKGLNLMKLYQPSGWRLVVELSDSRMEMIKYNFIHRKSKKDQQGESQTLLSTVKKILILAPNDEVIWSKKGTDLNIPKSKPEINNSNAVENNQSDMPASLKSLQTVAQCRYENNQKQMNFNNCENLRVQLKKTEKTVKLNEVKCKEKESLDTNTTAEIKDIPGPCKYSKDLDLRFIGNEMKKCILESCGQPTVISNIQNYQSCVVKVQEQVQKIMEKFTLSMQKSQLLINACEAPKQQVLSLQNSLTSLKCSQYSEKPELKNCE
ncbi:hypothetical protein MNBD_UNCLBAC01-218 [hydrothermal vent metagenome]|uniref:Uncharacterized protein n=1 Tax=hydrothermal vent metagenome TaxID=652676 RepID=A0A3B1E2Y1_9ZZZZ